MSLFPRDSADEMDFDPHISILEWEHQQVISYFDEEHEYMATRGYSDELDWRKTALFKINQYYRAEIRDAWIPFLAMNYYDRFISRFDLPGIRDNTLNDLEAFAIGCLSLAWKQRNISSTSSIQKPAGLTKEDLMMAELQILEGLDGKMESITRLSFARYFFGACRPPRGLKMATFTEIIIETQDDIRFTAFKPSVISASALLASFWFLYNKKYKTYENKLMENRHIDKGQLSQCTALMKDMCSQKGLWMETAALDVYEGSSTCVQAGAQWRHPVEESSKHKKPSSASKSNKLKKGRN